MSAYGIIELAVAVFFGNMMAVSVVKGYLRMKKTDEVDLVTGFFFCAPLVTAAAALAIAH